MIGIAIVDYEQQDYSLKGNITFLDVTHYKQELS